ncbi:MAG: ATP-binding cassette domain-containing protein [Rhodobacter sp.]|nr:ATP-binding cassette domain-containing protein [Rhodobacter sp.]
MLEVRHLTAAYGQHPALQEVSLRVGPGEIVVILGANGAGKSTLLRAISGICEGQVHGDILLDGHRLLGLTSDEIVERGVALVPEGRGIFGDLTVRENLTLGAYANRARADETGNLDRVLRLFPKLQERQGQIARTMSGGEQQMVAIGRAMMSAPQILMLDEPSLGLSPLLCKELFQNLREVKALGIGILLVEQNAKQSLAIADRGYLLENTRIVHEDSATKLATDPAVQKAYLGAGSAAAKVKTPEPAAAEPIPARPTIEARPLQQRTADQQIGLSIEDLVQSAAKRSETPPPTAALAPRATDSSNATRLQSVLHDIERAAAEARKRPAAPPTAASDTDAIPTKYRRNTDTEIEGPPPVIEVYRRPRVEVYRRRPSGQFERD